MGMLQPPVLRPVSHIVMVHLGYGDALDHEVSSGGVEKGTNINPPTATGAGYPMGARRPAATAASAAMAKACRRTPAPL